jgi:hypothetical protein
MRKEGNAKQIIVLMIIGLFLGTSIPSMGQLNSVAGAPLEDHDLAATNITVNNPVYQLQATPVVGKIYNAGASDETGVPVKMFFNYSGQAADGFEYYDPLPVGWTRQTTCAASTWFESALSYSACYPKAQETGASGLAQDEWMISPVVDCSALSVVRLYFTKYYYATTGSDSSVQVLGSIDGGATWPYTIYTISGTAVNSTVVNTTLAWAVGQASVKIALRFISTADTTLSDYFYFDDFFLGQPWNLGDVPPAGWTILNYGSEAPNIWNFNDWHRYWYGASSALHSGVARVYGTPTEFEDEWLISPSVDCTGLTSIKLRFSFYFSLSSSVAYINGSTDGGVTWDKPIYKYSASATTSYLDQIFDISSWAAGQSSVMIRFRFKTFVTSASSYIYIDNARIYSGSTYLLNHKFEGTGYSSNFDPFLGDMTDAWGTFGWKQTPVNLTQTTPQTTTTAYNQYFSLTSGSSPTCTPHSGLRMVQWYSYYAATGAKGRFYTSPMNIAGLLTAKFWMYHDTTTGAGTCQFQASTDGGNTWTNIGSPINRYSATAGWVQHSFDVSAYYAIPTVQFGLLTTSDYNANMYFDDFSVLYNDPANSFVYETSIDIPAGTLQEVPYSWTPTIPGACTITLEAVPVAGETIINNNTVARVITINTAADIWIDPTSLTFTVARDTSSAQDFTVGNSGTATLTGTITKDATWMTLSGTTINIGIGSSTTITVTVDGTKFSTIGDYTGSITITSNDPDESPLVIPVIVHVTTPQHDVAVQGILVDNPAQVGEITPITATIANIGLSDETDIPVTISATPELVEGFESCIPGYYIFPAGWSNTSINPTGRWFMYVSGTYPTATTYPKVTEPNVDAQDELLISPTFNCAALTQVTLQFTKYLYLATGTNTSVQILGSTDGGTTWSQVVYDWITAGTNNSAVTKDISSWAAGCANVKIGFRFLSPSGTTHGDYFYIDDIWIGQANSILNENFDGVWGPNGDVPPAGWAITTNETIPVTWDNNNWHKYSYGGSQLNVARVYYSPVRYQNESLISPSLDCSALSSVTLKFWHYFYYYSTASYGWVEGSTDGGTTWPYLIATYHVSDGPAIKTYDISSWAAGQNNVKVRFHYQDHDGEYWEVDDVFVGSATQLYTTAFNTYNPDNWGPNGWQQVQVVGTASGNKFTSMTSGTSPTCMPHGGTRMVQYNAYSATAGNEARFYTAPLGLSNVQTLKFWMFHDSISYQTNQDNLSIQISTDGTTWTRVGPYFYRSCTLQGLPLVDAWAQHSVDISAYAGYPVIYVAFYAHSAYGYNIYFDDLTIDFGTGATYTTSIDLTTGSTAPVTFATWQPATVGPCLITATAGPVTGETLTADNTMNTQITVLSPLPNQPPVLNPIGDKSGKASNPLTFTATATDPDAPPQVLTYTLDEGAPAGAGINPTTGVFTWTPTALQTGTHTVTIRVTDNGDPNLDDSETIDITIADWSENYDEYSLGQLLDGTSDDNGWKGWGNYAGAYGTVSNDFARSSPYSVKITGDSDNVHEYYGITAGRWVYTAWQYIPAEFSGQTYFILLSGYDDGGATDDWATQIVFDSTTNTVYPFQYGTGSLPLIKGQWVELRTVMDIDAQTWTFYYNGQILSTYTGINVHGIAAVDLFANLASPVYYDDILLSPALTLTTDVVGSGTVTRTPDFAGYQAGDVITLQANAMDGWSFDHWSGDYGTETPLDITITEDTTITAYFTLQSGFTITINIVGEGTVVKNPDQEYYSYGQLVGLWAYEDEGWAFNHWEGDVQGTDNPGVLNMTKDMTVTAVFEVSGGYILTFEIFGDGTVLKDPDQQNYEYGQIVTVTAVPGEGYKFDHWDMDLTGSENPTTITMTGSKWVQAYFTLINDLTLTVNIDGQGTVTKDPDQATYTYGDIVTLTAVPADGWIFKEWTGDVTGNQNPTTITMNSSKTVTATFFENHASNTPTITCTGIGIAGTEYEMTLAAVDPDGDSVMVYVEFGDGTNSGWVNPGSIKHTWENDGQFAVKAKAKDVFGSESGWSAPIKLYMTKTTRLYGLYLNKNVNGDVIHINAAFLIWKRPGEFKLLRQSENIIVMAGQGFVGKNMVLGKFYAVMLVDETTSNPTITPTLTPNQTISQTHN